MAELSELKIFFPFSEPAISLRTRGWWILIVSSCQYKHNSSSQLVSSAREEQAFATWLFAPFSWRRSVFSNRPSFNCLSASISLLLCWPPFKSLYTSKTEIYLRTGLGKALQWIYNKAPLMRSVENLTTNIFIFELLGKLWDAISK